MGARILNRRRVNQGLFDEPGLLSAAEIRAAGDAAGRKYTNYRWKSTGQQVFETWWNQEGRDQSNLSHSEAKAEFVRGFVGHEEEEKLDKWDIRQIGSGEADQVDDIDSMMKARRQALGETKFELWWRRQGEKESSFGAIKSKEEFLRGFMASHYDPREENPPRLTQRDVDNAAGSYQNLVAVYGENNMATERAYWHYQDVRRRYEEQRAKAGRRGNPELSLSKDLFSALLNDQAYGDIRRVPAGTPVKILKQGERKSKDRFLVEADYYGQPYYGWVWKDELEG